MRILHKIFELRQSAFINFFSNIFGLREHLKLPWNHNSGHEKGNVCLFSSLRIRLFGISLVHLLKSSLCSFTHFCMEAIHFFGCESPSFLGSLEICMLVRVSTALVFSRAILSLQTFPDVLYHPSLAKMEYI